MSEYILIIVWLGIMFLAAKKEDYKRIEDVCDENAERYKLWFAFLVFAPIIWMAGTREWFGDTGMYVQAYKGMPSTFGELPAYVVETVKDKGFYLFSALIKLVFGSNHTIYFLIIAAIQGVVLVLIFRKYSTSYVFSIFLFVISTDYVAWMYNGIRQFMAVVIIFAATVLMIKKKYVPLIIVILLASTMHQSALLMIPLVFIAQGEAWNQ